ncbi:MAG: FHA domain-containing protein [Myxococcota bacterium]
MGTPTSYRLRIDGKDRILSAGELVIGRSAECDVVLDDPMASRRHATLRVSSDGVVLEDLGSRNGVLVNGVRMFDPVTVGHGDRIRIGAAEMFVLQSSRRRREQMATRPLQIGEPPVAPVTSPTAPQSPDRGWDADPTERGSVYEVLVAACDRALLQNEVTVAEAAVRNLLLSVRAAMLRKQAPDDHTMKAVIGFALQMAERTHDPAWLDRLFEVMVAGQRVPDDATVQRLARLAPRMGLAGSESVRQYVSRMAERTAHLDPPAHDRLQALRSL